MSRAVKPDSERIGSAQAGPSLESTADGVRLRLGNSMRGLGKSGLWRLGVPTLLQLCDVTQSTASIDAMLIICTCRHAAGASAQHA